MIEGWSVVALALGYVSILFALAWYADGSGRFGKAADGRPLIYALSLAVYCTSWTFFGSVGLAASSGYNFFPVYLGPVLFFAFGWRLLLRIVRLAKSQNITSVADFLAARYGKSQAVAAIVTVIAVAGTLPYVALQLKAVAISVDALLGSRPLQTLHLPTDTAFIIAILMATFAVLFGTRHIDATEHQQGLIVAVAAKSLVKLAAFLTVGFFVIFSVFGGIGGFLARVQDHPEIRQLFAHDFHAGWWVTVTFLSLVCIVLLPRQFHVTVVENNSEKEIRRAAWLFPVYLLLINLFVVPIAAAGLLSLPKGSVDADTYVLALPLAAGAETVTLLAFVGGLSAATAMVIVNSVALAIMVCNGLVVPILLRGRFDAAKGQQDMAWLLLTIRRVAIFAVVLLGYGFYRLLGQTHGLATIGLVSFAAIAQFAPAFFGGLVWRNATARGAIAGIVTGFAVWAYTLLLPWVIEAGWMPRSILTEGPFGLAALTPQALFYLEAEPLTNGVLWSIVANVLAFVTVSLLRAPEPVERVQARVFVPQDLPRSPMAPSFRLWRTSVTVGELQRTVARYLGNERAARSFAEFAEERNASISPDAEADIHLLRFTEHLLASAIGAASSRLVLSLLLRRGDAGSQSALRLLDDASEALQYNRDLLQSALDQVRHGLSVFDQDMRLICWNRQFRELLNFPPELGRVGAPLDRILRACAERGDFGPGDVDKLVADRLMKLSVTQEAFQEQVDGGRRILEFRTSPMPQGGIVTTYSDITERVAASEALARANETLERRVRERTAELLDVNRALGDRQAQGRRRQPRQDALPGGGQPRRAAAAQRRAALRDEPGRAPAGRSRGDACAQHRCLHGGGGGDPQRPDRDLPARCRPAGARHHRVPLGGGVRAAGGGIPAARPRKRARAAHRAHQPCGALGPPAFAPRAAEPPLQRHQVHGGGQGAARRAAARRHHHRAGVRQRARHSKLKRTLIFKEFERLEETAGSVRGLGLGLSIVERIGKVLGHRIGLQSVPGRGSMFAVDLPRAERQMLHATRLQAARRRDASRVDHAVRGERASELLGMQALLDGWGCTVLAAEGTDEALSLMRERGRCRISSSPTITWTKAQVSKRSRRCAQRRAPRPRHRHHGGSFGRSAARGAAAATPYCASR